MLSTTPARGWSAAASSEVPARMDEAVGAYGDDEGPDAAGAPVGVTKRCCPRMSSALGAGAAAVAIVVGAASDGTTERKERELGGFGYIGVSSSVDAIGRRYTPG